MGVGRVNMTVHLNDAVVEAQVLGYEPADIDAVLIFPFQLDRLRLDVLPGCLPAPAVGVAPFLPALKQRGAPLLPPFFALFLCHSLEPPFCCFGKREIPFDHSLLPIRLKPHYPKLEKMSTLPASRLRLI